MPSTNPSTLFIAGYGAIGQGFMAMGKPFLKRFSRIVVMDLRPPSVPLPANIDFQRLDVHSPALEPLLHGTANDFVFINICAGTDNFLLREICAKHGGFYLDLCCSMFSNKDELRFSKLMPRTYAPVHDGHPPHMVCAGINPGLVEIIAKQIIQQHFQGRRVQVGFFELDTIHADLKPGKLAVAWSPEVLTEEIMLSPSMYVHGGKPMEPPAPPSMTAQVTWSGVPIPARIVGHEEVWNICTIPNAEVVESFFAYSFSPPLMQLLDGDVTEAREKLIMPGPDVPVHGTDTIVVQVKDMDNGNTKSLCWSLKHSDCHKRFGINAVQLQTSLSALVFAELLCDGKLPASSGRPTCASDLDVALLAPEIDALFETYGIKWKDGSRCNVSLEPGSLSD